MKRPIKPTNLFIARCLLQDVHRFLYMNKLRLLTSGRFLFRTYQIVSTKQTGERLPIGISNEPRRHRVIIIKPDPIRSVATRAFQKP